jgi:hypothetical protein
MEEMADRMERVESGLLETRKALARLEAALVHLTKFVSRTEYNRITRLSKRVKDIESLKRKKR